MKTNPLYHKALEEKLPDCSLFTNRWSPKPGIWYLESGIGYPVLSIRYPVTGTPAVAGPSLRCGRHLVSGTWHPEPVI